MKEQKLKFKDESNDREYFTMVPNYILNHSSPFDQALYLHMKRMAGENGRCWASKKELAKRCQMSVGQTVKSLKYLLDHGWIKFDGLRPGKTKPAHAYTIVDIWRLNVEFYSKKDSSLGEQSTEKVHQVNLDSSPGDTKEEPYLIRSNKDSNGQAVAEILHCFEDVNPAIKRMYGNITQRAAAGRLIARFGFDNVVKGANAAVACLGQPFAPRITTPYELETSWAKLVAFYQENQNKKFSKGKSIIGF